MRGSLCTACAATVASRDISDLTASAFRGTDLVCVETDVETVKPEGSRLVFGSTATKTFRAGPFCNNNIQTARSAHVVCIMRQASVLAAR